MVRCLLSLVLSSWPICLCTLSLPPTHGQPPSACTGAPPQWQSAYGRFPLSLWQVSYGIVLAVTDSGGGDSTDHLDVVRCAILYLRILVAVKNVFGAMIPSGGALWVPDVNRHLVATSQINMTITGELLRKTSRVTYM